MKLQKNTAAGPASPQRITVRIGRAAAMLDIGRTKLYELIAAGEIEVIKIGTASVIPVQALKEFVERQRKETTECDKPRRRRGRPRATFTDLA